LGGREIFFEYGFNRAKPARHHSQISNVQSTCHAPTYICGLQDGVTCMMKAAEHGHIQVLELLLEKRADVNATRTVSEFGTAIFWFRSGSGVSVVSCSLDVSNYCR
jgi:hypothetical protein